MSSASEPRVNGAAATDTDRVVSLPVRDRDRVLGVRWDARSKEAELNCAIFNCRRWFLSGNRTRYFRSCWWPHCYYI